MTTIHRLALGTAAPSERSPLEHAAMAAAGEIKRPLGEKSCSRQRDDERA